MLSRASLAKWLWPLLGIAIGVLLLLRNFLLIDFDVLRLWPVILIAIGFALLLRGDVILGKSQPFAITRGSVERADLDIDAGIIDVRLSALRREERLISGQFSPRARPELNVHSGQADIRMRRGLWPLWPSPSLEDWELGVARDLPWRMLISAYLGDIDVDLGDLQIEDARFVTGIGDVILQCAAEATGPIEARSTLGDVRISIPDGVPALIRLEPSRFCTVYVDPDRYQEVRPNLYATATRILQPLEEEEEEAPPVESETESQKKSESDAFTGQSLHVRTVFGDVWLT